MIRLPYGMAALAAGAVLLSAPAQAQTQTQAPKNECFFVNQFENWSAGSDERTMYIRVSGNRFYRLDLAGRCSALAWPAATLVNNFRSPSICSPLDFDMKISTGPGSIAAHCTVKAMTRLSADEVAALPRKQKP